jgi:hypothetical protein
MEIMMLEWQHHEKLPMYFAKSTAKNKTFCVFYDDIMYWDDFSGLTPTQDLEAIKQKAQEINDSYK